MSIKTQMCGFLGAIAASVLFLSPATDAQAEALTFTDIAGREVTLPELPDKIILGEGRMMYGIAPPDRWQSFRKNRWLEKRSGSIRPGCLPQIRSCLP